MWVPGDELADRCASDEALRAKRLRLATEDRNEMAKLKQGSISMAFIKGQARREANREWSTLITQLDKKRGYVTLRKTRENIPKIPRALRTAPKRPASTFFQLASGHAMIAPFLKEKFGWIESDTCWWCMTARQTREHLFKECPAWKEEIEELWKEAGEAIASLGGVLA